MLFFAIEDDAAGRMAWGVEHLQTVMAKSDDILMTENPAQGDVGKTGAKVETHHAALLVKVLYHRLVIGVSLGLQSEGLVNKGSAKHMVKVAMRAEMVNGFQLLLPDIVLNSMLFVVVKGTTVNDDTLFGVVAHYVAVLLQRVYLKSLDSQHGYNGK